MMMLNVFKFILFLLFITLAPHSLCVCRNLLFVWLKWLNVCFFVCSFTSVPEKKVLILHRNFFFILFYHVHMWWSLMKCSNKHNTSLICCCMYNFCTTFLIYLKKFWNILYFLMKYFLLFCWFLLFSPFWGVCVLNLDNCV